MRKNYFLVLLAIVFTVNGMAQNIPSYVPKDGLVAWYPFNGNANDESGNGNHGTVNGATLTADRNGKANSSYSFDGVSNFITINNNILNNKIPTSFAISLWVDFDTTKQCEIISNRYGQDCGYNYRLLKLDNKLIFGTHIVNPWTWDSCSTELNTTSEWNQITFMYDLNDKRLKLYLNGKFVGANNSNIWFDGNNPTIIGALLGCGQGSFYSKGTFDDIAIYNRALTQQEITALYTEKPVAQNIPSYVPKDGLVAWYPFNGNANDYSGNGNDLHPDTNYIYPTPTKDRFGNSNSAYNFNSNKCLLTKKTPNTNGVEFTWSIWIKKNNNDVISSIGLGESNPTSTSGGGFDCYENKPQFICQGINSNVTNSSYTIKKDDWYFFTVTKDKYNNFNIYINGILNSTGNSTYLSYDSTTIMYVNGGLYGIGTINSDVDDIAMWNRILSDQEITALYTSTPVAQNIPSYVPKDGLVGYWPFNGNANDESGNGNNGTVNGATLSADRNGKANSAYSFDGQSNFIEIPKTILTNSNSSFTITFWFKTNKINSTQAIISESTPKANNFNYKYAINFSNNLNVGVSDGTNSNGIQATTQILIDKWSFGCMVYNSSSQNLKVFFNGVEEKNITNSIYSNKDNFTQIGRGIAGANGIPGAYLSGKIDDISIYNRALTEQEISQLYVGCSKETATSSSFNSLLFTNGNAISVAAEPQGGVFTGTSIENNQFIPSKAKIGSNKVKYNFKNSQGCADSTVFNMVVADTVGKSCTKFDTVIVKNNVFDTVKVNKYDTITITKNVTKYDTITVTNKVTKYDTVLVNKYDTITFTNTVTKYDTVIVKNNVFDTVKVNKYDTITITKNVTKYDTVIVKTNVFDTVKVNTYDTITVTNNITKYDTVIVKTNVFDTVKVNKYDTITITNNVTKYDTVKVTKFDTVTITNNVTKYDTVIVNKTNYDTVGVLKIKFKLTTGISANQLSSLSIYPNPTSDVLHIEVSDAKVLEGYRYRILDALGKEVYNELVTQSTTEIPLKTIGAAGIYQFEILDATKTSIQSNKIVLH